MSLSLKRKITDRIAVKDKCLPFKKKLEFWKTWTGYQNLDCASILKTFWMRLMVALMNVIWWILCNQCVNIWKICRTQWLFLKWPMYNVIKSQAGQRSVQSARWTSRFFCYGVAQKIHWQCSDSTQLTLKNIFLKKKEAKGEKKESTICWVLEY